MQAWLAAMVGHRPGPLVQATHRPLHRLLGFGIVLTISIQALVNLAVVTGLAPTKGIALPLLSSGGTGWIMVAYCIGLLGSIDRRLIS